MEFKNSLQETLDARFTDPGEVEDITNHGVKCGWHGFLYTYEINEFFHKFESEIEDYFYEIYGNSWIVDSGASLCDGMDEFRAHLVWSLVELYCYDKVEDLVAV